MSNHLAFAAVTETLRKLLDTAIAPVAGAHVSAVRPAGANNSGLGGGLPAIGANVFLYQITPNAAGRNNDLPTRRSDGTANTRPSAAFDLHYLISFYGEDNLDAQRVMGLVVQTLHSQPVLTRQRIANNLGGVMPDADLAAAPELVRFTPLAGCGKSQFRIDSEAEF